MQFESFDFRGFKSLSDVVLDLDHVTVVTGPNGAGKTNLVEALSFLSESLLYGLEIAVARAGGFDNIAFSGGDIDCRSVGCTLTATFSLAEFYSLPSSLVEESKQLDYVDIRLTYDFEIVSVDGQEPSNFKVGWEYLELRDHLGLVFKAERVDGGSPKFFRSKRMKGRRTPLAAALYPLSDDNYIKFAKDRLNDTDLIVSTIGFSNNIINLISSRFGQAKVFQLTPHQCRQPGVSTPNAHLSRYGENLPSVVYYLRQNRPKPWSRIESAMRTILPQLRSIETTFTQDRRLSLTFRLEDSEREWNANEMSDGTIQALALFVALFDDRSPVLIVEEPENALHPWILRHFLALCREQGRKQILITTHSPIVIDYTLPENLRIMWNRNGESHVSRVTELNPEIIDLWKTGQVSSFDIYDSGLILEYLPEEYLPEEPH